MGVVPHLVENDFSIVQCAELQIIPSSVWILISKDTRNPKLLLNAFEQLSKTRVPKRAAYFSSRSSLESNKQNYKYWFAKWSVGASVSCIKRCEYVSKMVIQVYQWGWCVIVIWDKILGIKDSYPNRVQTKGNTILGSLYECQMVLCFVLLCFLWY
jgi:hypothetical protein